jgi:hypothetical protein
LAGAPVRLVDFFAGFLAADLAVRFLAGRRAIP